jgi:multiple sugar transport system ATP-binding protein
MASIKLDKISKRYGAVQIIDGLDLAIIDGEFLVLVGPSGCGKSTALRMIAGLEEISSGMLSIGERVVNNVDPKDRDIAMVFQSYALYPHMTVYDNIGFPLRMAGLPKDEADRLIRDAARSLELSNHLDRKPAQLSGGQRQRVAMGRAIVRKPSAFLMDEPLSNLDAKLRVQMRAEIARLQKTLGVTTVYVTHDQVEAMTMGDRVAVLKGGYLQQVDAPQTLYDRPANIFVAGFIGSPAMNLYQGRLGGNCLTLGSQELTLPDAVFAARPALNGSTDRPLTIGIRPEDLEDAAFAPPPAGGALKAEIVLVESLGAELMVHFVIDAVPVDAGDPDAVKEIGGAHASVARFDPRSRVKAGETMTAAVTLEKLHFFDPDTHQSLW